MADRIDRRVAEAMWHAAEAINFFVDDMRYAFGEGGELNMAIGEYEPPHCLSEYHADRALELLESVEAERKCPACLGEGWLFDAQFGEGEGTGAPIYDYGCKHCALTRDVAYAREHGHQGRILRSYYDVDDAAALLADAEALAEAEREIATLTAERDEAHSRLHAVELLLATNGCDCDCGHRFDEHDDDCDRCLACRIEDAITEDDDG